MKNLKNILLASLTSAVCLSQIAYADNVLKRGPAENVIHTTLIQVDAGSVDTHVKFYVGKSDKSNCQSAQLVEEQNWSLYNRETIVLDGDILARVVGLNYTCAKEVYFSPQNADDPVVALQYALSHDKKIYTATNPSKKRAHLIQFLGKRSSIGFYLDLLCGFSIKCMR